MKLVINYFSQTAMVGTTEEAVAFINTLHYGSNVLSCNSSCRNFFADYFSGHPLLNGHTQLATTGCSTTRIMIYEAMAGTLDEHNRIVLEKKELLVRESAEKANAHHQQWLSEMYAPLKGWYVVTIDVLVSKLKGNDGNKTYSFKVLADNQMDAYNKACQVVMERGIKDRNVSFVYHVTDSASAALIEFVGVWSDESTLEYGTAK